MTPWFAMAVAGILQSQKRAQIRAKDEHEVAAETLCLLSHTACEEAFTFASIENGGGNGGGNGGAAKSTKNAADEHRFESRLMLAVQRRVDP